MDAQSVRWAVLFAFAASTGTGSDTVLPDGTYRYEMTGSSSTRFAGEITVSRDANGVTVREATIFDGEAAVATRRLDPKTLSLLSYALGDPPKATLTMSDARLAVHGAPSAYFDFMPASFALVPAIVHASGATTINGYAAPILGGAPEAKAVRVVKANSPRPTGATPSDVAISLGASGESTTTIWYDPDTFVTSVIDMGTDKIFYRLLRPNSGGPVATVPITYYYGPLGVDVRTETQTLHLMLDPAADFSVTPKAAKAVDITSDRVPELDLGFVGNVALRNVPANVQNGGVPDYDGAIGTPIFTAYRTIVDVANRAMSLYRFDKRPLDGTVLPIDLVNGKYPAVRATIGGVPVRLAIVLEASGEVMLKRAFALKHALLPAHAPLAPRYSKADAVFDAGEKLLMLGTLSQTARTFVSGGSPSPDIDGYIGLDIMRAYVMEFDYSQHELGLKPIRY